MLHGFRRKPAAEPSERRRDMRQAVVQEVARLVWPTGEELCLVRDVAPGGLKAEIYRDVPVGVDVQVELRTGRTLAGRVAWTRDGQIGVAFHERVPISGLLTHCSFDPRVGTMRPPRVNVDLAGTLRVDFHDLAVRVLNISQAGMRVAGTDPLRPGSRCQIGVGGLASRPAIICWSRDGEGGLMLDQPLSFAEFAGWRGGADTAAQPA